MLSDCWCRLCRNNQEIPAFFLGWHFWCNSLLTHWCSEKMVDIYQTTFSNAFSWIKIFAFLIQFDWSLFLRIQLTIIQHRFRKWLGADQATSHYLNQWWSMLLTHISVLGLNTINQFYKSSVSIFQQFSNRAFDWLSALTDSTADSLTEVM